MNFEHELNTFGTGADVTRPLSWRTSLPYDSTHLVMNLVVFYQSEELLNVFEHFLNKLEHFWNIFRNFWSIFRAILTNSVPISSCKQDFAVFIGDASIFSLKLRTLSRHSTFREGGKKNRWPRGRDSHLGWHFPVNNINLSLPSLRPFSLSW